MDEHDISCKESILVDPRVITQIASSALPSTTLFVPIKPATSATPTRKRPRESTRQFVIKSRCDHRFGEANEAAEDAAPKKAQRRLNMAINGGGDGGDNKAEDAQTQTDADWYRETPIVALLDSMNLPMSAIFGHESPQRNDESDLFSLAHE